MNNFIKANKFSQQDSVQPISHMHQTGAVVLSSHTCKISLSKLRILKEGKIGIRMFFFWIYVGNCMNTMVT